MSNYWKNKRLIIPTSFEECLTYGQMQDLMIKKIEELDERVTALEEKSNTETEASATEV